MRIIAIHLPQFHRIPENDSWWGEGFTEWTNVKRAKPLFEGHLQPRVPLLYNGEEAHYDLSKRSHLLAQMELARKYGVDGFCFYHYWFKGKQLLEKPVEMLLEETELPIGFMLCWANEPWTRTWDGNRGAEEILVEQDYGDRDDWERHIQYFIRFFRKKEYIKVDNRPVIAIYKPSDIIGLKEMISYFNTRVSELGFPNGCFVVSAHRMSSIDETPIIGDAIYDFEPFATLPEIVDMSAVTSIKRGYQDEQYQTIDYEAFCRILLDRQIIVKNRHYLGVFPGWDNSPRRGKEYGMVFENNSPEAFGRVLKEQIKKSKAHNNEFLFINAWNEWGEGAMLEPDEHYGYKYL